jgi:hypothetical protein
MRCGTALFLVAVLAGCATASGGRAPSDWGQEVSRSRAPLVSTPPPRVLLAMSDGPVTGGESTGPTVQGYNV